MRRQPIANVRLLKNSEFVPNFRCSIFSDLSLCQLASLLTIKSKNDSVTNLISVLTVTHLSFSLGCVFYSRSIDNCEHSIFFFKDKALHQSVDRVMSIRAGIIFFALAMHAMASGNSSVRFIPSVSTSRNRRMTVAHGSC